MRDDKIYETHYGYWFNLLNERAYHHTDVLLNLVQLVGGSAAAFAALQNSPLLVVASGLALAICAAISLLIQPGVKAEQHRVCKAQWLALRGTAHQLNDNELENRVTDIQTSGPTGLGVLMDVAFNATMRATGREDARVDLGAMQKLAAILS